MAVVIRLARRGRKKLPHFSIEVADSRFKRFIEVIGRTNPAAKMHHLDLTRYDHWISQGANPTDTVRRLYNQIKREEVAEAKPAKKATKTSTAKKATASTTKKTTATKTSTAKSKASSETKADAETSK